MMDFKPTLVLLYSSSTQSLNLFIYLNLPTYPSIYSSIHLSTYLSIYRSINLAIYLYFCLFIYISIYPSIYLSIYLSIYYLSVYLTIHPSIYLSINFLNDICICFSPVNVDLVSRGCSPIDFNDSRSAFIVPDSSITSLTDRFPISFVLSSFFLQITRCPCPYVRQFARQLAAFYIGSQ